MGDHIYDSGREEIYFLFPFFLIMQAQWQHKYSRTNQMGIFLKFFKTHFVTSSIIC